jgi:hypothetical protein
MGHKVISITLAGNSGQPAMAVALNDALQNHAKSRIFRLQKKTILGRIIFMLGFGFRLRRGKQKYVIHLGLEALLVRCFFPLRGKVVFVHHGIYRYPDRFNVIRVTLVFLERLGNMLNDIYYVNSDQMYSCHSVHYFSNQPDVRGLKFNSRNINHLSTIGFVGSLGGQKNCRVLKEALRKFPENKFIHLHYKSERYFFNSPNYQHLEANERNKFFNSIDVLLVPSVYESYCLVAHEAIFCGIHVIHSGVDALSKFPYYATVVDKNKPMEWVIAIQGVMNGNLYTNDIYTCDKLAMIRNANSIIKNFKN